MASTTLSTRGTHASDSLEGERLIWEVISNLYHAETNPDGYVSLGVAENALMHNELLSFLKAKSHISSTVSFTYGDGPSGSKAATQGFASLFNSHFHPVRKVEPQHVMVTNGVSSAIEHLSWGLANPGEGILLGRPYYRAFLADIGLRTDIEVVSVSFGTIDPFSNEAVQSYEKALQESEKNGVKIRAIMLCHPHNPLGRCYPKDTIIALMSLCQKYKIHLISDEIYALSVWRNNIDKLDTEPAPFQSALSIDLTDIIDPSLVHVLWGFSKDFGANGVRIGALVSQSNPRLLSSCRTSGIYSSPSSLAEQAAIEILGDEKFIDQYTEMNQKRLSQAYSYAVQHLQMRGIEYRPGANAAFFLWINLGKFYLSNHPKIAEDLGSGDKVKSNTLTVIIFEKLLEKKVFIVRGDAAGAEEPGWFRLVFSQPQESVEMGIERIVAALE